MVLCRFVRQKNKPIIANPGKRDEAIQRCSAGDHFVRTSLVMTGIFFILAAIRRIALRVYLHPESKISYKALPISGSPLPSIILLPLLYNFLSISVNVLGLTTSRKYRLRCRPDFRRLRLNPLYSASYNLPLWECCWPARVHRP